MSRKSSRVNGPEYQHIALKESWVRGSERGFAHSFKPKSHDYIILSLIITTIIYILVGISAVSVISAGDLAQESAPLARIAETAFGQKSFIILSAIALFSTFNTALMMLLSGSRLVYGISKEKAFPKIFSSVSRKTLAPWIAIIGVVIASIILLFIGDLKSIANLTNFTVFSVFIPPNNGTVMLSCTLSLAFNKA